MELEELNIIFKAEYSGLDFVFYQLNGVILNGVRRSEYHF